MQAGVADTRTVIAETAQAVAAPGMLSSTHLSKCLHNVMCTLGIRELQVLQPFIQQNIAEYSTTRHVCHRGRRKPITL
jgi:hypothetical protein